MVTLSFNLFVCQYLLLTNKSAHTHCKKETMCAWVNLIVGLFICILRGNISYIYEPANEP